MILQEKNGQTSEYITLFQLEVDFENHYPESGSTQNDSLALFLIKLLYMKNSQLKIVSH